MKKFLMIIILIFVFVSCKQVDEMQNVEENIIEQNSSLCKSKYDIKIQSSYLQYIICPFKWNTTYPVLIKNMSKDKTYSGIVVATAYYHQKKLHMQNIEYITLEPHEKRWIDVFIRINRPCVFNPPPPPLPKVTHCVVTFETGAL